jgi:hypothetical protein
LLKKVLRSVELGSAVGLTFTFTEGVADAVDEGEGLAEGPPMFTVHPAVSAETSSIPLINKIVDFFIIKSLIYDSDLLN